MNKETMRHKLQDVFGDKDNYQYVLKNYIQIIIFYKFVSDKTIQMVNEYKDNNNLNVSYEALWDDDSQYEALEKFLYGSNGYFIEPEDLYEQFLAAAKNSEFEILLFEKALIKLEESTLDAGDWDKRELFNKVFSHIDFSDRSLGRRLKDRNELFQKIFLDLDTIDISDVSFEDIGVVYDLISDVMDKNYIFNNTSSLVPNNIHTLVANLLDINKTDLKELYDPNVYEGSLLVKAATSLNVDNIYGQEWLQKYYNLSRINAMVHNIPNISLKKANFLEFIDRKDQKFAGIVSYMPDFNKFDYEDEFSTQNNIIRLNDSNLKNDVRQEFLYHIIESLEVHGTAIVILPNLMLGRMYSNAEVVDRLLKDQLIDAMIELPKDLFFDRGFHRNIIILSKKENLTEDYKIMFIDASREYTPSERSSRLETHHIDKITEVYRNKEIIAGYSNVVDISSVSNFEGDKLNISNYVTPVEEQSVINIDSMKMELNVVDQKIDKLLEDINKLKKDLELQ